MEVAAELEELADFYEAQGIDYKPYAYRRAAKSIRNYPVDVEILAERGQRNLEEIDDVGEAIASKTMEYLQTGNIEELEELRAELPVDMLSLRSIEGVGPKMISKLHEELGIQSLEELDRAAQEGEIQELSKFGPTTEKHILSNIREVEKSHGKRINILTAIALNELSGTATQGRRLRAVHLLSQFGIEAEDAIAEIANVDKSTDTKVANLAEEKLVEIYERHHK